MMSKNEILGMFMLTIGTLFMSDAYAYEHEVWSSNGRYYWKTFNVERGSSTDLAIAIEGAMGDSGNRDIHVLTSGTLYSTLNVSQPGVRIHGHGNTLTCSFTGSGILNNGNDGFEVHNLTLRNVVGGYGIRSSAASSLRFTDLRLINIDWIGIRIDSRTSNPWNYTEYNLYMRDIYVDGTGSHAIETYSIDGVDFDGTMTVRNAGGCGVLLNKSHNGSIETVDAYNCDWGGGYAGLRFANGCSNITAQTLFADRCGRGFFIVQSGPTVNCHLNYAQIRECSNIGIWIENGTNCSVKSGCSESGVAVTGSGSYVNVNSSCSSSTGSYSTITNRNSVKCIEVSGGSSSNSADIVQNSCNSSHWRQQWELLDADSHVLVKNRNSEKCLRVVNGDLVQYDCNTSYWSEQFTLQSVGGGYYLVKNRDTGTCLRLTSSSNGASVVLDDCNSSYWSEQFSFLSAGSRIAEESIAESLDISDKVLVYPNPVTNELNINLAENVVPTKARIFNLSGQTVLSTELTDLSNKINVQELKPGTYFIEVTTTNGTQRSKLIKR